MKCCHGNLVSSCEVVSGYADHDNNNDTQKMPMNTMMIVRIVMYVISRTENIKTQYIYSESVFQQRH